MGKKGANQEEKTKFKNWKYIPGQDSAPWLQGV